MSDWKKIGVGQLFKVGESGSYVAKIVGYVIDVEGNKYPIQDCEFGYWTAEEIKKAENEAARLSRILE